MSELEREIKTMSSWEVPQNYQEIKNFSIFDKYMRENGAIINKNRAKWENKNSRYLIATQNIAKGEDVIAIP